MPAIRYETPDGVQELRVDSSEIEYNDETQHWKVKRGKKTVGMSTSSFPENACFR